MSEYIDKEIKCCEPGCDKVRTFTAGEQEHFEKKKWSAPKRCKEHAAKKRADVEKGTGSHSVFAPALKQAQEIERSRGGRFPANDESDEVIKEVLAS